MQITPDQLKQIAPYATQQRRDSFLPFLNNAFIAYHINSPARAAAFLAQIIHESGSFNYVLEIADGSAYEGREDLGNTQKGDGKRYKGRGLIQITGRANYRQCGDALGLDLLAHPEYLEQPQHAVNSAAWFWSVHGCNELADGYFFTKITKIINGGTNGLKERKAIYALAQKVLGA